MKCKDCSDIRMCYCMKRCGVCYKDPERIEEAKMGGKVMKNLRTGWCQVCREEWYGAPAAGGDGSRELMGSRKEQSSDDQPE